MHVPRLAAFRAGFARAQIHERRRSGIVACAAPHVGQGQVQKRDVTEPDHCDGRNGAADPSHVMIIVFAMLLLRMVNAVAQNDKWPALRAQMVETQLRAREIRSESVLNAMARVPRHLFVPADVQAHAYEDRPLPIGHGQTISQPYIVAYMTEMLQLEPGTSCSKSERLGVPGGGAG